MSISNVFASPKTASRRQRRYNLCGHHLADGSTSTEDHNYSLVVGSPPDLETIKDNVYEVCEYKDGTMEVFSARDYPEIAQRAYQRSLKEYEDHKNELEKACEGLHYHWRGAFDLYGIADDPYDPHNQEEPNHTLYFEPHVSLPDVELLDRLYASRKLVPLILLTARHELGHCYLSVKNWYSKSQRYGYFRSDNRALSADQLHRLSARIRGYSYFTTEQIAAKWGDPRDDAPIARFESASDVGHLYWQFLENWYRPYYFQAIEAGTCQWVDEVSGARCKRVLGRPGGPGGKPRYCDEHREAARRHKARLRQQRQRESMRKGQATPYQELNKVRQGASRSITLDNG